MNRYYQPPVDRTINKSTSGSLFNSSKQIIMRAERNTNWLQPRELCKNRSSNWGWHKSVVKANKVSQLIQVCRACFLDCSVPDAYSLVFATQQAIRSLRWMQTASSTYRWQFVNICAWKLCFFILNSRCGHWFAYSRECFLRRNRVTAMM